MVYECQVYDMDGRKLQKIMCNDYRIDEDGAILSLLDFHGAVKAVLYYANASFIIRAQYID